MVEARPGALRCRVKGLPALRFDLELVDKSDWVKVFEPRDFTVFVENAAPPAVGEQVRIDLTIARGGPRVIFRGRVIARHPDGDASVPPGFSVALGPEEREKVNYLNGFVRGGLLDLREKRRLPLRLPVTYGGPDGPRESFTRDINEEGVFVISEDPLPEGSELDLRISIPGRDEPLAVAGTIGHTVVVEDEDVPGMGIRFVLTEENRKPLQELVDDLEAKFNAGELPDDVVL
jgi:Tfp pilus assembly protein PilZ